MFQKISLSGSGWGKTDRCNKIASKPQVRMVYLQEWRTRFKWLFHTAIIAHIHTAHALLFHKKEIHPNMKQRIRN